MFLLQKCYYLNANGALLELDNEQSKQNLSWPEFGFVVSNLVDDDTTHIRSKLSSAPCFFFKKAIKK